jgi:hypothetical protein
VLTEPLAMRSSPRTLDAHWVGELFTSALSTAVGVSALALVLKHTQQATHTSVHHDSLGRRTMMPWRANAE